MDPPSTLLCDMHPYQKQAHGWMSKLENGKKWKRKQKLFMHVGMPVKLLSSMI